MRYAHIVLPAVVLAGALAAQGGGQINARPPLVLKDEGSFFAGGTKTLIQYSAGPAVNRPGHIIRRAPRSTGPGTS